MPLRKLNIRDIKPFDYAFEGPARGRVTDSGRNLGCRGTGLIIRTVAPGAPSFRRHRHLFQEEMLIVMAGGGPLHRGEERVPVGFGDPEPHRFENTQPRRVGSSRSVAPGLYRGPPSEQSEAARHVASAYLWKIVACIHPSRLIDGPRHTSTLSKIVTTEV